MNEDQTLQQSIREYESNMPPEIMELIKSFDWRKEMRTVVNQNQLMIDVGADLEQSIYLMLLGVVQAQDVYARLIEVHEMPEDKAKKVIEEIENSIFKPMHQKLMSLEEVETKQIGELKKEPLKNSLSIPTKEPTRDDILAEIENEPEPMVMKPITTPTVSIETAPVVDQSIENDIRISKPFSLSDSKEITIEEPVLSMGKVAEGVQEDPVMVGLGQPTVVKAVEAQPTTPTKSYAADPYREPIE